MSAVRDRLRRATSRERGPAPAKAPTPGGTFVLQSRRAAALTIALAMGCLSSLQAAAQGVTLADAVEAAWQRSAQSTQAAGALRQAEARRSAADALWAAPPALEAGVTRDRQHPDRRVRETELGLAVPLWLPGQRAAGMAQADAASAAARAELQATRLAVAGSVLDAAAEVALQRAEQRAADTQRRELDQLASDVDRRVAAGDLAPADALAARAELLAASSAATQAQQRLQAAQLKWKSLTGLAEVPTLMEPPSLPGSVPPGQHPALQAAALNVEWARRRVDVARASGREAPELLLRARQETATGEPRSNGVGLAIRIPFGTDDRNGPMRVTALAELDAAEARARELASDVESAVETARLADAAARRQVADERERAELLRQRAALIEQSFKAGETALPEMLRALTAAAQADAALARQLAALAQAAWRLQLAQGHTP